MYFEEWDEPQISGIRWVSELIAIAGGDDIFRDIATGVSGAAIDFGRILTRKSSPAMSAHSAIGIYDYFASS